MNDQLHMKDILEMAEVLTAESSHTLEVKTFNQTTGAPINVVFVFNLDQELIEVYAEN